jgi:hypothetical protein
MIRTNELKAVEFPRRLHLAAKTDRQREREREKRREEKRGRGRGIHPYLVDLY